MRKHCRIGRGERERIDWKEQECWVLLSKVVGFLGFVCCPLQSRLESYVAIVKCALSMVKICLK